jgi:cytochrome c oxidase assembly protein subunit 15
VSATLSSSTTAVARPSTPDRMVGWWLTICALMIFVMVVIGGVTRLTESGLSIVEWQPLFGALPPITTADWQELFAKYQQFPEYQKVNFGMTLADFKGIFWLEYIHRLWGRLIGLAFAIPALVFLFKGWLRGPLRWQVPALFVLGGAQGALGWFMVESGLVNDPRVSAYRLTAHLLLALSLYGWLLWLGLGRIRPNDGWSVAEGGTSPTARRLRGLSHPLALLVVLTICSGGFVAGTDAGFTYNTFPLMDGRFVPEGYAMLSPFWHNVFENIPSVQFNHRWLAVSTALCVIAFALYAQSKAIPASARIATGALLAMALIQPTLGIATLLTVVDTPIAALHQAGAVVLLSLVLWTMRCLKRRA